jgi:hypothetical protein
MPIKYMNPYNPFTNYIESGGKNVGRAHYEEYAIHHFEKANDELEQIRDLNPKLAEHLGVFMMECLMALNAYHHDIFASKPLNPSEDMMTRMRKNR